MKNPVNLRFTGFLVPIKGLSAEKEELSRFLFFEVLQGLKRTSKFTDPELAPF